MGIPTLAGITAQTITTPRITTRVLFYGSEDGTPLLFIHGNLSSATWWEEVMVALPAGFRGIAYDQRGYGEADPTKKVNATRGMGDLADDAIALLDTLNIEKAHIVGISMGGAVVWRMLMDSPERFISAIQINPGSPYGVGGTKDSNGTPTFDDFAGSGAGLVNAEVVKRIAEGERGSDSPFSPRNAMKRLWKAEITHPREEEWLSALLSTHIGEQDYPGDKIASDHYPNFAPGEWGVNNALSPKYLADVKWLYAINNKPPILWLRGAEDKLVADQSLMDFAVLGQMGLVPGYPGAQTCPHQPMLSQTRSVLDEYARTGGTYQEVVIDGAGHVPYVEKPAEFNAILYRHLTQ